MTETGVCRTCGCAIRRHKKYEHIEPVWVDIDGEDACSAHRYLCHHSIDTPWSINIHIEVKLGSPFVATFDNKYGDEIQLDDMDLYRLIGKVQSEIHKAL